MKTLFSKWWVFALVFIFAGMILLVTSWCLGAGGGYVYIDHSGVHVGQDGEGEYKTMTENDLESFSSVEVSTISADIELIASDHFGFEAQLPMDAGDIEWKIEDGKLTIDGQQDLAKRINLFNFGFWGKDYYVKVYYKDDAEFDAVRLKSTSGSIKTDAVRCSAFSAETVSGDNKIKIGECGEVKIGSTSGNIKLDTDNTEAMSLQLKTVSGNVDARNVKWSYLFAESVSGEVEVHGEAGAETTVKSVSGNVRLKLASGKKYSYAIASVSGGIYVNGQRMGSPAKSVDNESADGDIRASTTSGEVRIEF